MLGERLVPAAAYYGIHTLRATENFALGGAPISSHPNLIRALAEVKHAAARTNRELAALDVGKAEAIEAAAGEVAAGALRDQFVVDVLQGGAGTSTNMNANEVLANRGLELLGHRRGEYEHLHPLDDVNRSQSTNDAYPTAGRLALRYSAHQLEAALAELRGAFEERAEEFADLVKVGRTQLQDAVPIRLGDEFRAYGIMVGEDELLLRESRRLLSEVNLGGTAVGTGVNAPAGYSALACEVLSEISGEEVVGSLSLVEATQDAGGFVQFSGVLKRIAVKLSKICNDLRLLSSGPLVGFGELRLPSVQAGSSIMPGKVNPVIPEMVNQIAFKVAGGDLTVTMAAEGGQLQLNAFEPVILHTLLESAALLRAGATTLARRCVVGIEADRDRLARQLELSIGSVAALNPCLGYELTSAIAKEALATGKSIRDLVVGRGLMTRAEIDHRLLPEKLVGVSATGPSERNGA